jgi:hypothetical protein
MDQQQIRKLLNLAEVAAEFEHVDVTLIDHFNVMREELGLAKLLLLIQDYVRNKTQNPVSAQVSKTSQQNTVGVQ